MADITQNFSQLLLTYGPGAMLDLPEHAVVVAGLQDWRYTGSNWRPVEEERLVALLRQQLGAKLSPSFPGLAPSPDVRRRPPRRQRAGRGSSAVSDLVPGRRSLRHRRTRSGCRCTRNRKAPTHRRVRGPFRHQRRESCPTRATAKKADVNPIRFVGACAKGHLQDIDWRFLAHRNGDRSCRKPLFWVERGVSSDPSDISVRCTCGASVTLADLYKPKFLGGCACHSPWLTPRRIADETCNDDLRLLPRSATNTYFPQTVTVISLTKADDRVRQTIAEHKTTIDGIRSLPNFLDVLRADSANERGVQGLFRRRDQARAGQGELKAGPQRTSIRVLRNSTCWRAGRPSSGAIRQDPSSTLRHCRARASDFKQPWAAFLKNVVKVHRLREVTCLYGFTRLEPPPTSAESELDEIQLAVDGADLARTVEWLPAIEQFGEGIFLHVAPEFLKDWLDEALKSSAKAAISSRTRTPRRGTIQPSASSPRRRILGAPFLVPRLHGRARPGMRLSALVLKGAHLLQRPSAA